MQDAADFQNKYLQVRRVVASIAYENGEIDEQERRLLATGIGDEYSFSMQQISTLIEDAINQPPIESLVAGVTDPVFLRFLIIELVTLSLAKHNWEHSEISAAHRAIASLGVPTQTQAKLRQAFDLLLTVNEPSLQSEEQ
jgi:hypothetical protein